MYESADKNCGWHLSWLFW